MLRSHQVDIFSVCSDPWKPQYAQFSVITFIVIIGSFSFCIQTWWMSHKKIPKKPCLQDFLYFIYFSYTVLIDYWRYKKSVRVINVESFLKKEALEMRLHAKMTTALFNLKKTIQSKDTFLQHRNFPGNEVVSTLFPELRLVKKYNDVFKNTKLETYRC